MSENSLKFYLITDLHHWAKAQGTSGEAYEREYHHEHRCLAETGAIINEAIDRIIRDTEIDIVEQAVPGGCRRRAPDSHRPETGR